VNDTFTLTAAEIHRRIDWPTILQRLGVADEFLRDRHGPCPVCGGKDRYRFDNRTGHGDWFCNVCRAGDGFTLLMRLHSWDFPTTMERVSETAGLSGNLVRRQDSSEQNTLSSVVKRGDCNHQGRQSTLDWSDTADFTWRKTLPLRGTVGQTYLEHRGCVLPPRDSHLRYLQPSDRYPPSLCAAISDVISGEPISLHFTRLAFDGRGKAGTDHHDKLLLKGHRKGGGCIRLWPDEAVTYGLAVAEGIETALAAARAFRPVWATVDAGNLAAMPVVSGIESLTIIADHDDAGIRAARECAQRWAAAGRQARIALPKMPGMDAADVVGAAA
jgi:putative DNA primase/helicase